MTNADRDKITDSLLHLLWGKAKESPYYDKEQWKLFQAMIKQTQEAANAGCPECDEREQHRAEAEDGMRNAAEIAGLQ